MAGWVYAAMLDWRSTGLLSAGAVGRVTVIPFATRSDKNVSIGVAEPKFPMPWPRIELRRFDEMCSELPCTEVHTSEVIDVEPERHAMTERPTPLFRHRGVTFIVPRMELKDESTVAVKSIVSISMGFGGRMTEHFEPEKLCIPSARKQDIVDRQQWLWAHIRSAGCFSVVQTKSFGLSKG